MGRGSEGGGDEADRSGTFWVAVLGERRRSGEAGRPSEGDAEVRMDAQASCGGVDLLARLGCSLDI